MSGGVAPRSKGEIEAVYTSHHFLSRFGVAKVSTNDGVLDIINIIGSKHM